MTDNPLRARMASRRGVGASSSDAAPPASGSDGDEADASGEGGASSDGWERGAGGRPARSRPAAVPLPARGVRPVVPPPGGRPQPGGSARGGGAGRVAPEHGRDRDGGSDRDADSDHGEVEEGAREGEGEDEGEDEGRGDEADGGGGARDDDDDDGDGDGGGDGGGEYDTEETDGEGGHPASRGPVRLANGVVLLSPRHLAAVDEDAMAAYLAQFSSDDEEGDRYGYHAALQDVARARAIRRAGRSGS